MTAQAGGSQRKIVVGVDGSASSKAALAWAASEARMRGAMVEVVIAWETPTTFGYPVLVSTVDWEQLATQVVDDAVGAVADSDRPAMITTKVLKGNAAQVLLEQSAGADLLVVGNRGHGGFVETLLGSTGQLCVHHATCPVVVIRNSDTGEEEGSTGGSGAFTDRP
jgi:nucleotide-binding universal stress UspA family protein